MDEPIITLLSSQSTKGQKTVQEDEPNDDDLMVSFAEIQFDPEEDNIPDNMLMPGKQFKILNHKLNSLLQIQVDLEGWNFVSGIEMDIMQVS